MKTIKERNYQSPQHGNTTDIALGASVAGRTAAASQKNSAIFFGTADPVPEMRETVLEKRIEKYVPETAQDQAKTSVPFSKDAIRAYELKIEYLTAKFIDKPAGKP